MEATYSSIASIGFDMNYLILDFPHPARCDDWEWHIAVDAFEAALKNNNAKGAFVVGMAENIPEEYTNNYSERGIVSFYGIDEALQATEIAADIGIAWKQDQPDPVMQLEVTGDNRMTLDEASAKQCLGEFGVPLPAGDRVDSVTGAVELAARLGYPVVLKALGIAHKTEHDAVRLNLATAAAVEQVATELFKLSDQLYLEAMQPALVELIVGVTRDQQFGLVLTIGSGGILVELLKDAKTLLIPAQPDEIEAAVRGLRSAPLLNGYRGKPAADIEATVAAILAIQEYAISQANSLIELDVNPLLIGTQGEGVFAADALIVLEEKK
jgi:acyl-CoA synthetase (NDP forming)